LTEVDWELVERLAPDELEVVRRSPGRYDSRDPGAAKLPSRGARAW
jgi:hypothetical protein